MNAPHLRLVPAAAPGSKPRPDNMFQHLPAGPRAPMRDKLLFTEAMMASDELTGRQLRIGYLLVSYYSAGNGDACPSMQFIADALGIDKRNVGKDLKVLEAKGWFYVDHGTRGRGKNHVNRYRPNVEKVSSATPFKTAARKAERERLGNVADQKRCQSIPEKVSEHPVKGVTGDTLSVTTISGTEVNTDLLRRSCSPEQACSDPPDFRVLEKLKEIERRLKGPFRAMTPSARRRAARSWLDTCEQIFQDYPPHRGPIGGMAYRLCEELEWVLSNG
jgi:hypothetical protein